MRQESAGRVLACVAGCALLVAAAARGGDADAPLEDWLARTPAPCERYEPNVVERRRSDSQLGARLIRLARDGTRPGETRRRALALDGAVDDRPEAAAELRDPALADTAPVASRAAERIEARATVRARLVELLARPAAGDPGPPGGWLAAKELAAVARDPLERERTRTLALLLLSQSAEAARAEPADQKGALGRELAALVADGNAKIGAAALRAVPVLGTDGVAAFGAALLPGCVTASSRLRAIDALGRTRSAGAVVWIDRVLRDAGSGQDDDLRAATLVAQLRTGARSAGDVAGPLVELAFSPSSSAQARAMDGLGELPPGTCEGVLAPRLEERFPADDREHAARMARALGLRALVPHLEQLALDEGASLGARTAAVRALGTLGSGATSVEALVTVLRSPLKTPEAASLRQAAAVALGAGELRGDAARRALADALGDSQEGVRLAALRSLGNQKDDPHAREALLEALGRTGATSLGSRERAEAVAALAALGAHDDETVRKVVATLDQDPGVEVAVAVADYLANASRRVAIEPLLGLLQHADYKARLHAHATLLAVSGAASVPGVDPFGYDPSPAGSSERDNALRDWRRWWQDHSSAPGPGK